MDHCTSGIHRHLYFNIKIAHSLVRLVLRDADGNEHFSDDSMSSVERATSVTHLVRLAPWSGGRELDRAQMNGV